MVKSESIRAKVVLYGQKWFYPGKLVVFGQRSCIWAKVVVVGQKLLYSGKGCCIRAKWL